MYLMAYPYIMYCYIMKKKTVSLIVDTNNAVKFAPNEL